MTRVLTYTLTLEEPCLLAAPGGDPNTETSLSYIPGGALRGALVAAYLRDQGSDSDPAFEALFLSGRARYLNAYPLLDSHRALPTPRAWTKLKDMGDEVYNRADPGQFKEADQEILSGVGAEFVTFAEPIKKPKLDYEIAVHTARNREKGRAIEGDGASALFRYQALARDQSFTGAIIIDDGVDASPLIELLENQALFFGGSHTAGYGRASVSFKEQSNSWREVENVAEDIPIGGSFIAYLASPTILYEPETGQPSSDILPFLPNGPGGYEIEHSFAAMTWVGGFNKQRGLPLSQQWALQMGSTWVIKTAKPLTVKQINELEIRGIGARTEEGFGRLIINPNWPKEKFEIHDKHSSAAKSQSELAVPTAQAGPAHPLLPQMNKRIIRSELDRRLTAKVIELADSSNVRGHLSPSQFGRLQVRVRRVAEYRIDNKYDFTPFITYLNQTKDRKSADDQFRKYAVKGQNFRDYIKRLAEHPSGIWNIIGAQGRDWPRVGQVAYDFGQDDELAGEYAVKFIANLCRQLSKLEVNL